jgi:lysophospholipase L1-like esterase
MSTWVLRPALLRAAIVLIAAIGAGPPAVAATACPAVAPPSPIALPATEQAIRQGAEVTVIAFGSSSTEGAGATAPYRSYPARLEAKLRAALPDLRLRVLNRGKGGEDVMEMLARLEREVIATKPTLVIWQAGANAVLRGMPPDAFRAAMEGGLARLRATGADVVLMDNQRAPRILANPSHVAFEAMMRGMAADLRVPLFSRAALMRAWEAAGAAAAGFLTDDGLHHNDRGYDCLATALAENVVDALKTPPMMAGR